MCFCYLLFFFKQKTAYEMRISDWSSDVCSSDLQIVWLTPEITSGIRCAYTGNSEKTTVTHRIDGPPVRRPISISSTHRTKLKAMAMFGALYSHASSRMRSASMTKYRQTANVKIDRATSYPGTYSLVALPLTGDRKSVV